MADDEVLTSAPELRYRTATAVVVVDVFPSGNVSFSFLSQIKINRGGGRKYLMARIWKQNTRSEQSHQRSASHCFLFLSALICFKHK